MSETEEVLIDHCWISKQALKEAGYAKLSDARMLFLKWAREAGWQPPEEVKARVDEAIAVMKARYTTSGKRSRR